jgi:hypothetical protein
MDLKQQMCAGTKSLFVRILPAAPTESETLLLIVSGYPWDEPKTRSLRTVHHSFRRVKRVSSLFLPETCLAEVLLPARDLESRLCVLD